MRIKLPSGTPAELARPLDSTPFHPPADGTRLGVALAPDVMGLRPLFDDLCAWLARERGWVVCAPEPFAGREELTLDERLASMKELQDSRQVGDLAAAADATGCERAVVMGFCMGGMYALKATGTGRFEKAVSFYGPIRVPEAWQGEGQLAPLDVLANLGRTTVLAIIGGRDIFTPPEDVAALRSVKGVTVVEYPEAEHGFVHDPARPAHRAEDAADAWAKVFAFLS